MGRLRLVILGNENPDDCIFWIRACKKYEEKVEYRIVNLIQNSWLDEIQRLPFDVLLSKPGGLLAKYKQLYDERIYILGNILGYKIFPSPLEVFLYENKRFLSFWLKANRIPHPLTNVFYDQKEAQNNINVYKFPLVAKTNIGASGSGIKILKSKNEALKYIKDTFKGRGSPQRIGPNLDKGGILWRGFHYVLCPSDISKKLNVYMAKASNLQKDFVIFQEYIPHEFEWRVVRIGDSYFAHKKLKKGEKASGTLLKVYDNPPLELFDFVKDITDKHHLYSQAIDIFESSRGYLVNEMQCIFGQSDSYQMLVNKTSGRYRYLNNEWKFEEGDFASNQCYDIRLDFVLNNKF
jgi:glutathione synthase/RimK-type ligase-like ATP-grasp enzyme